MKMNTLNNEKSTMPIKGVLEELSIKIFIDITIKKVYFYQNGAMKPFKELPQIFIEKLINSLLDDTISLRKLKKLPTDQMLERFAFQIFSTSFRNIPD